ncbi:hypothetical protein [Mesorhizobium sp. M0678]|uniref:hypothetical protein n=1 Tax=Mesorhizobium sp. M0678 TaxID=2956985 RepID=UPI003339A890
MSSNIDSQRAVTKQDLAGALVALSCLPKRLSSNPEIEFAAYETAIEGVMFDDLAMAVKAILKDALGHAFFPAPPELRRQCNAALDVRATELARAAQRQREREQRLPDVVHSPEQRARVAALHRAFHESLKPMAEADEIEEIRKKYDPGALAAIPDRT